MGTRRARDEDMRYRPDDIRDLPTLCVGQCCSLKVETHDTRVWLCRVADGVTVERLDNGRWYQYDGRCTAPEATDDREGSS